MSVCTVNASHRLPSGAHSPAAYGVSTGPKRSQLNSATTVSLSNHCASSHGFFASASSPMS